MSNIKITQEQIDELIEKAKIEAETKFGKCTVLTVQLENGFILTESSGCIDPENYDFELGYQICLERIKNKLWELMGFNLQQKIYKSGKDEQ